MTITRAFSAPPITNTLLTYQQSVTNSVSPGTTQTELFSQGGQLQYNGVSGQAPLATKAFPVLVTLVAGAATLDLTALTNGDQTEDMTGLSLMELQAIAHPDNANPITIAPGASNGYSGWVGTNGLKLTTANDQNKIGPLYGGILVDGTHKTIDIAGTGTQKVYIAMLFGDLTP